MTFMNLSLLCILPRSKHRLIGSVLAGLALHFAAGVHAQTTPASTTNSIKFGLTQDKLTAGLGQWRGSYIDLDSQLDRADRLTLRVERAQRFGDSGRLGSLSWTHELNPDSYFSLYHTTTDTGNFWPISQSGLSLSEKFLGDRSLVGTLNIGRNISRNNYRDWQAGLSLAYYSPHKTVYEGGVKMNVSKPGSVKTARGFVAVTYGAARERYLSANLSFGKEGYQLTGATVATNFASKSLTLSWKEWIGQDWGAEVKLVQYRNPNYKRMGVDAGAFVDF
jgi:YaiO family outer membrane protein